MQAMFMLFDSNQDGKISRAEFKSGLRMLGLVSDKYGDELRDWQVRRRVDCAPAPAARRVLPVPLRTCNSTLARVRVVGLCGVPD